MPSLPTSLILVGLVVAWLVVLVPMIAKRREQVPENHEDSAGFRVLERRGMRGRRRPVLSRTAVVRGDVVGEDFADDAEDVAADGISEDLVGDLADGAGDLAVAGVADGEGLAIGAERNDVDRDAMRRAGGATAAGSRAVDVRASASRPVRVTEAADLVGDVEDADDTAGDVGPVHRDVALDERRDRAGQRVFARDEVSVETDRGEPVGRADNLAVRAVGEPESRRSGRVRDAADDWEQEHAVHSGDAKPLWRGESRVDDRAPAAGRERSERAPYRAPGDEREVGDVVGYRPVPVRPGRGGFDPRAAERARAYRFRQRRRVALVLVALMLAGVPVGLLGIGYGWVATVAAGVLLVLYLAYLRRQVRIEEAIRQRRAARLERARQIRPGYRPSVAEQVYAHRTGEMPRVGADVESDYLVRSHVRPTVPPSSYLRGEPVDFEDSDPAFDDLEYYRPAISRRRAG